MIRPSPDRSTWPEAGASASAVEETLGAFGLRGTNRPQLHGLDARHGDAEIAGRLRRAMEALGPMFRWFGRFVAMRLDWIDVSFWLALGQIEDRAEPVEPARVALWIEHELGARPEQLFASFDTEPVASNTAFQVHRARLKDSRPVLVKLRRPDAEEHLLASTSSLRALREPLGLREIDLAIEEFRDAVSVQLDLESERAALESCAGDAAGFEWMAAARPVSALCGPGVLVVQALEGPALADVLRLFDATGEPAVYCAGARIERLDAARLLCTVWLHHALVGHAFPADPAAEWIVFTPGRRLAIGGEAFVSLESQPQGNLWRYLLAVADDDPGTACRYLMCEMKPPNRRGAASEMERRFRQLVPFRDGGWNGGDAQFMTHEIFCQWRTASQMGFVPAAHLSAFYRGFARVAMLARRLAPEVDAMREAVRELRMAGSCSQLFGALRPEGAVEWMRQYIELALVTPRGVEEVLQLGSPDDRGSQAADGGPSVDERRKKSVVIVAALLVAFAAASLMGQLWGVGAGPRGQTASVAAVAVAGALLLAAIARME